VADFHHEFERDMRDSLRPREAPGGFADRMMRRIPASGLRPILQWPVWRWSAAAAVLLAVLLGDLTYQHQQHIAGERARRQVLLAFRITSATLQAVQQKISDDSTKEDTP
jgi:hypothetical protein